MRPLNIRTIILLLIGVSIIPLTFARPASGAASDTPSVTAQAGQTAASPTDSGYVGAQVCKTCHADIYSLYEKTKHRQTLDDPRGPSKQGCEACHGPGAAHAQDPSVSVFNFKTAAPSDKSARCLSCHNRDESRAHFSSTEHKLMGVACDQCHDPHLILAAPKERVEPSLGQAKFFSVPSIAEQNRWLNDHMLRQREPDLCFGCHKSIQAAFALPTHHRVPEGLMKCTDCHNPHGNENRTLLKKASWEACVGCHVEKRGPYVYEHPVVKVEGCVACHNPHGSINRNLLLRGEGRFLCLQCHVNPPLGENTPGAENVPHGRVGYQTSGECVRCHTTIHGSSSSEFFLN